MEAKIPFLPGLEPGKEIFEKETRSLPQTTSINTSSIPLVEKRSGAKETKDPVIQDHGEKIGGARKDRIKNQGRIKKSTSQKPKTPAWRRGYVIAQDARTNRWFLAQKTGRILCEETYPSEELAEKALLHYLVGKQHRIRKGKKRQESDPDTWEILRVVSPKKLPTIKGGFTSQEEAQNHLETHAKEILTYKFPEPERPWLDHIERQGPDVRLQENIHPEAFLKIFNVRGVEFGNWNMGGDGQEALNHAYDAFLDLARILQIDPKKISLGGELALALGSRGCGLHGSRAHYERPYAVINLTKIKGAGALAHEWFHALDHYLARLDGKADRERTETDQDGARIFREQSRKYTYQSHGCSLQSQLPPEEKEAFQNWIRCLHKTKKEIEVEAPPHQGLNTHHLVWEIDQLQKNLEQWKKNPLTSEEETKFQSLLEKLKEGDCGPMQYKEGKASFRGIHAGENLFAANAIYKKATGRSFLLSDPNSQGQGIQARINNLNRTKARLEKAQAGEKEIRQVTTEYFKEAYNLDLVRIGDYYTLPHELAARAFEACINDLLEKQSERSDYLVYGTENKFYLIGKPYPEKEERALFLTQWQETWEKIKPLLHTNG